MAGVGQVGSASAVGNRAPPGGRATGMAGVPRVPTDMVTLSPAAQAILGGSGGGSGATSSDRRTLTPAQQRQVAALRARDAQVRTHEAAHEAAGAGLTGPPSFTYVVGPDGRTYVTGGDVTILLPGGGTPAEQIQEARQVRAAALAPSDPSGQDLAVAAQAAEMEAQAEWALRQQTAAAAGAGASSGSAASGSAASGTGQSGAGASAGAASQTAAAAPA